MFSSRGAIATAAAPPHVGRRLLPPRTSLQHADGTADPLQGGAEINSGLLLQLTNGRHLLQQLKSVPKMFGGSFGIGLSGDSAPTLECTPAFRAPSPVYAFPQVLPHRAQDGSPGRSPLI